MMEVECGDGEDGVETKTDREEVRNGIVSRVNDREVPSPLLSPPPSSLPSHPSQEGVDVPNSQDAVTLIDADKSNQSMVESLGEEEEKVRVERRERGWGRRGRGEGEGMGEEEREGSGALKERICKFSLTSWYILKLSSVLCIPVRM